MEHLAKVELVGRVGTVNTDIVKGYNYYRFSIGVDTEFSGDGGSTTRTSWFSCVFWGETDKLWKGNEVRIEGRLTAETYHDREGRPREYYEVKVQKIW